MKGLEKRLSDKANFDPFCNLIALILSSNSSKGFRVTKIVKGITFEGVRSELESRQGFPGTISHKVF